MNWVTFGYLAPVLVGIAGVILFMVAQGIKGARFHKVVGDNLVTLRARVIVRKYSSGRWSREYGARLGSSRIDLIVRPPYIEVTYVGRPMGGISGMQWFFDATKTQLSRGTESDRAAHAPEVILTEVDAEGRQGVRIAIQPVDSKVDVWDALTAAGAWDENGDPRSS